MCETYTIEFCFTQAGKRGSYAKEIQEWQKLGRTKNETELRILLHDSVNNAKAPLTALFLHPEVQFQ